jgi:hypothetical protein
MVNFPNLTIVPSENLVIHEKHDHQRTTPLIRGMKSTKIIRNPPIVAPLDDGTGRYMVLDGANRTIAIKKIESRISSFKLLIRQTRTGCIPGTVVWEA